MPPISDVKLLDCMEGMAAYPDKFFELGVKHLKMKDISDLQIGKAGEYIVCADLILKGFVAFPSEQ